MESGIRNEARTASRVRSVVALLTLTMVASCRSTPVGAQAGALEAGAPPNQLTRAERDAGWRLLFDGRTLAGWRGLGYPGVPEGHWTVEDGAIRKVANAKVAPTADGRRPPGGDLMTVATFRDFELSWDWKM